MPTQSSWLNATDPGLIGKGVGAKGKKGAWSWDEELRPGGKTEAFSSDAGKID